VREILKVLNEGCRFLAFDESAESTIDAVSNKNFYEDPNLETDEQQWQ
jgi:hypothetical protein